MNQSRQKLLVRCKLVMNLFKERDGLRVIKEQEFMREVIYKRKALFANGYTQ